MENNENQNEQFIKQEYRVESAICYIPLGFLFVYFKGFEEDEFLTFHRKQSIVLFWMFFLILIFSFFIPFLWGFIRFLNFIFYIIFIVIWIKASINSKFHKILFVSKVMDLLENKFKQ